MKTVKLTAQENKGSSGAGNKSLEFARGEYVQWIDEDVYFAPDKLSQQLKEIDDGQDIQILLSAWGESAIIREAWRVFSLQTRFYTLRFS